VGSLKKEIVIVAVIVILAFFALAREPEEPKDIVNDKVILNYTNVFFDYRIERYPTSVEITSPSGNVTLGFVTDPWNLKFGIVPGNGSYIRRYINIKNSNEKYDKIKLKVFGNISPLVNFSRNEFVLNENESAVIEVRLKTDSAEYGNYSGEIDLIVKVPKYDFLRILT